LNFVQNPNYVAMIPQFINHNGTDGVA